LGTVKHRYTVHVIGYSETSIHRTHDWVQWNIDTPYICALLMLCPEVY